MEELTNAEKLIVEEAEAEGAYSFKFADKEGPLDLLLYMIKKSKVEIEDVKLADTTETFLTVDSTGLKLSGVQNAIDSAVESAESRVANTYATKEYVGIIPNTEDKYKDVNNVIQYVDKKATEVLSQATDNSS